ncbi:MAG: winged helix DNA-binding protein [Sphingobium sp.]|nr:winged helix DNA-binding protein [Sphingobium sp.]
MPIGRAVAQGRPASALAHESIVAAALDLLDEQGLTELTMSALAGRMGRSAPEIEACFPSRNALLAAMAGMIAAGGSVTGEPGEGWRGTLHARAVASRRAMLSRRDGGLLFSLLAALPDMGGADPAAQLCEAGFSFFDARAAIQLIDRFVCAWAIAEQAHPDLADDESAPDFDGQIETLLAGIAATRASGAPAAEHRLFQGRLWVFLRNARDSANIAFARADHINELDRRILLLLQSQGGMTLAAVSMANGVDKAQVSRAIKRLGEVGLVQRSGIRSPLRLSTLGRHLADRLVRLAELRNRELTFGIADDQLVDLFAVLDILLARAMALYEQERKLAAAAQDRDAEIDFPERAEAGMDPDARAAPDRSRILPPFIALCSYMMRGGSLGYKRKTGLSNFDTWVLVEVCRDPPISWPQLVLALYRDQSQAGRTINRLIEIGLVERSGKPGRRHGFFGPTPEGARIAAIINGMAARRSEFLFQGIPSPQLNNFMAAFDSLSRNAEVQLAREKAVQEMDRA